MTFFEINLPSGQIASGYAHSENEFHAKLQNRLRQYGADDECALALITAAKPGTISYFNANPGVFNQCLYEGLSAIADAGRVIEI